MTSIAQAGAVPASQTFLRITGRVWFVVAAIGQLAFVSFILAYYGVRTASGNWEGWNDKPLIDGHIEGDTMGNLVFVAHVLPAAIITLGGVLQLAPHIRRAAPAFHRWNGRLFLLLAYTGAASGLWLTLVRGTQLSWVATVAILIDATLIFVFATLAWRFALARRFDIHQRWAMRTFLVVNGVWFLRVGIMGWVVLNQGPVGMTENMDGPADIVLNFSAYLLPIAVLEVYYAAQRSRRALQQYTAGAFVLALTAFMAVGVFGTVTLMWGPYL